MCDGPGLFARSATVAFGVSDDKLCPWRLARGSLQRHRCPGNQSAAAFIFPCYSATRIEIPCISPSRAAFPSSHPISWNLVLSLPEHYVIAPDVTSKAMFRQAICGIVRHQILDRKGKIGFAPPGRRWLATDLGQAAQWTVKRPLKYCLQTSRPFAKIGKTYQRADADSTRASGAGST